MSLNHCCFIGNLGADPEHRHTQSNTSVCNFRIACNEKWKNQEGEKQERTEWVRVVVWGKLADVCSEYLSKGRQVHVSGRMATREWEDRDGNKRWTTEIVASDVVFLGGGGEGGRDGGNERGGQSGGGGGGGKSSGGYGGGGGSDLPPLDENDIPF